MASFANLGYISDIIIIIIINSKRLEMCTFGSVVLIEVWRRVPSELKRFMVGDALCTHITYT